MNLFYGVLKIALLRSVSKGGSLLGKVELLLEKTAWFCKIAFLNYSRLIV